MAITIKQSVVRQKALVVQAMLGQNLGKAMQSVAAPGQTKHIMFMAYIDAIRRHVDANDAGNQAEADAAFASMSRIYKEMNMPGAK